MYLPFQGRLTAGVKRRRSGGVALTPEIVAADPTRLALLADLPFQGRYYQSLLSGHMR